MIARIVDFRISAADSVDVVTYPQMADWTACKSTNGRAIHNNATAGGGEITNNISWIRIAAELDAGGWRIDDCLCGRGKRDKREENQANQSASKNLWPAACSCSPCRGSHFVPFPSRSFSSMNFFS